MESDDLLKRTRQLIAALIVSGTINILLLLALFFSLRGLVGEGPVFKLDEVGDEAVLGKAALLRQFEALSYDQLTTLLSDKTLVEDGFTRRDLGLGCLVSMHHFNIAKALPGTILESRQFQGKQRIILFPGLNDDHFKKIMEFASTERWPLTSQGLFLALKNSQEPSLIAAFSMTQEFASMDLLMRASSLNCSREKIAKMISEGSWKQLSTFALEQKEEADLSPGRLQKVLTSYVESSSSAAAEILVQSFPDYALKRLDDQTVSHVLRLLKTPGPAGEAYAKEVLLSPRSKAVWKEAAYLLYHFHGETLPPHFDYIATVRRFVPTPLLKDKLVVASKKASAVKKVEPTKLETSAKAEAPKTKPEVPKKPAAKKEFIHVVRQGESLWTIARQYHVDSEKLKSVNKLKNDTIKEGQLLVIP